MAEEAGLTMPPSSMIAFIWNCRRIGRTAAVHTIRVYVNTHKPNIVFISELHSSPLSKIQSLFCSNLGFDKFEFVPAIGRAGGLTMFWKQHIDMRIVVVNDTMISGLIFSHPSHTT